MCPIIQHILRLATRMYRCALLFNESESFASDTRMHHAPRIVFLAENAPVFRLLGLAWSATTTPTNTSPTLDLQRLTICQAVDTAKFVEFIS